MDSAQPPLQDPFLSTCKSDNNEDDKEKSDPGLVFSLVRFRGHSNKGAPLAWMDIRSRAVVRRRPKAVKFPQNSSATSAKISDTHTHTRASPPQTARGTHSTSHSPNPRNDTQHFPRSRSPDNIPPSSRLIPITPGNPPEQHLNKVVGVQDDPAPAKRWTSSSASRSPTRRSASPS